MKKKLAIVIIVILLITGSFYGYKRYRTYKIYKEDAVYLLDFLENNYPYFEVKEKTLNYKFLDHKDEFIKKIAESKNDTDFYKNIQTTMLALQNLHSHIVCDSHFLEKLNADNSVVEKNYCWQKLSNEIFYIPDIIYTYIQGKYIVNKSMNKDIPIGSIITEVNGKDIIDYINSNKDFFYQRRDFKRNVFYASSRNFFKYNDSSDNVTFIYNGQRKEAAIKYLKADDNTMKWYFSSPSQVNENNVTAKLLNDKTAYLRINSFNSSYFKNDKNIITDFFKKCKAVSNIVIDIRGNSGGSTHYGDLLISKLIDKKITIPYYHCFKNTEFTKENIFLNMNFRKDATEIDSSQVPRNSYNLDDFRIFKTVDIINPSYDSIHFKGNIYILADNAVYSSSEYFINIVKKLGLAKIIGITTGGDGPGFEPISMYLPNSKLAIQMPIDLTISGDGTVNEEIHTQPDIYIEQSLEDYQNYLKSGLTDIIGSKYGTVYNKFLKLIEIQRDK